MPRRLERKEKAALPGSAAFIEVTAD